MKLIIIRLSRLRANKVIKCPCCEEKIFLNIGLKEGKKSDETKKMS